MRKPDSLEGVPTAAPAAELSYEEEVRRRQRSRALVMGLALAAFAILVFAITIVRIGRL